MNLQMTQGNMTLIVAVTDVLARNLAAVNAVNRGQFAYVAKLVSGTVGKDKCERPSVTDRWMLANPRYDKYAARMIAAIAPLTETDIHTALLGNPVASRPDFPALFTEAKDKVLKGYAGTREDTQGHRDGQANCYATYGKVKVHLVTETGTDGLMHPVLNEDGYCIGDSAMLPFFEIKRHTHQRAEYGHVNHRALTIVQDTIKERARQLTHGLGEWKTLSLHKANFEYITLNSVEIAGMVRDTMTAELDAAYAEAIREIGNLAAGPWETLQADAATSDAQEPATVVEDAFDAPAAVARAVGMSVR